MFILNPDLYSLPTYRIGTFVTQSINRNYHLDRSYSSNAILYFNNRFGENNWLITKNGREGIALAMQNLDLPKEAVTTILTTSNNFYISSCVTSTIQEYTNCSRQKNINTKAFFVNHEFGYLYPEMEKLVAEGLPIIEDCCTSFFSQNAERKIGLYGEYSVFSFPKFFSIQIGGLLVGAGVAKDDFLVSKISLTKVEELYVLKVVGYEFDQMEELLVKRKEIFDYATKAFEELGFNLRFSNKEGEVPSVLLLNNNGIIKDLDAFKIFLYQHGIQNSIFYGEDAFFIPCHQNLEEADVNYFKFITESFLQG
jgi:hypothetical protein